MDLSGYELELLRDDGELALYRARQPGEGAAVLALVAGRAGSARIPRLQHEYALAPILDPRWAARPLALDCQAGPAALFLEDNGGEPLSRGLGRPLELTRFLRLAVNLAAALGEVHRRGLIHKDVKPANLLIDAAGDVRLTGFGMASRLPRERQEPAPPEIIAGSFAYMAPEQTGRMNRSIDTRSDLYALGVTFYEMLTGTLPFTAADPMEWIHCHIARRPAPPGERVRGIPRPIEAIVLKLLAKTAEERYQTAAGLAADLRRCLGEWEATGGIADFPLGDQDVPDLLRIPERLYGREPQVRALLAAFDRMAAHGRLELVLVAGYSGIGKSSVVSELHKVLVPSRGLFAAGKFDQYKRDIPYATLAQAFQALVRYILGRSDAEVGRWRDALRAALGGNAGLMLNLIPELEFVIGPQPPVLELPPQEAQKRFRMVFRRLLGVFARPDHPLALFLDDLQWLDPATLALLVDLASEPEVGSLLLVGAYRDNEVDHAHPLMRSLAAIRKAGAPLQEIRLAPLAVEDVCRLVADALHCGPADAWPLARLVYEKTGGNPFFAIQFLTALAEEKLLSFDGGVGAWIADIERIRRKGYTDNVVELMVDKLARLPHETQEALKQLACLGSAAPVEILSLVQGRPAEAVHAGLWDAVEASLVFRSKDGYSFAHDRVQEAAYSLIPEAARAETHLRIGRMLASRLTPAEIAEQIFDLVNQLNRGSALLRSQAEREQVAELNLMAGARAKAATAYAAALKYFAAGRALLTADGWQTCYRLAFALELDWAACNYLTGELAVAEEHLSQLSLRARTIADLAAVACVRINLYTNLDHSDRAVEVGLDYLRRVDDQWPAQATAEHVRQAYDRLWERLGAGPVGGLLDLPLMTDPDQRATMDVLTVLTSPALFTNLNLFRLVVGQMAALSLAHGNSDGSCLAYAWLGGILGTYFGDYHAGFRFGRLALDLVEKRGLGRLRARVYLVFAVHAAHWTQPLPACRDFLQRAFAAAQEGGDLTYAAYSRVDLITNLLAAGDPLGEIEQEALAALDYVRRIQFGLIGDVITAQLMVVRSLRGSPPEGPTAGASFYSECDRDERGFVQRLEGNPRLIIAASRYWIRKLQAQVYAGDRAAAVAAAAKVAPLLWTVPTQIELSEYHFYGALAQAAGCDLASTGDRPRHWQALAAHRRQIAIWAENGAATFASRLALIDAEIARLDGRTLDAERLYEEAIRLAREHSFVQNEALGNELAARFYSGRGFERIAELYLRDARDGYLRWGAEAKARQLEQQHPQLRPPPSPSDGALGTPVEQLDLATAVKLSQAVAGEIDLRKLIDTLMVTALEHAGGERGLLILPRGQELQIEAEAATLREQVDVRLRQARITGAELPESILRYVVRTRENVLLNDASQPNPYAEDGYIRRNRSRSVLCLPLIKQAQLMGVLYLENSLSPHVFTPARIALLRLLASQAAISLENARLYANLQQAEAYLAEAQRISHTGSFGWHVASGELFWSEESFRIFDYDPATRPTLEMVLARVHPDDRARVRRTIDHAARHRQSFDFEHRLLMPDDTVKDIQAVGHPVIDEPGDLRFVGALMDITQRKHARAELERSEQRYRQLFRDMPVALWRVDSRPQIAILDDLRARGVGDLSAYADEHPEFLPRAMELSIVEEVNDYALRMFGARDRSELLGPMRWVWRESPDTFRRAFESRYRGEELFQEETKLPTRDGRVIDVLYTVARPRVVESPGITLVSLVDLTERVRAQEMLQRVQSDFAHAARISMLGELTASIAHELNQPLAAILTNGQVGLRWLDRPAPELAKIRQATMRIVDDARRSADIIARIRSMAVRRVPGQTLMSLDEIIGDALMFLRHEAQSRGVAVSQQLAPGAPRVLVDRVQFQQVIVNLAVNAMQAMAQAGSPVRRITIRTAPRTARPAADTLFCAVEDSGPGIVPEHLDRLFDSFFTTKEDGMGMGLSICRSIIEAHGGHIAADNQSAHGGARVYFTLPAAEDAG